MGSKKKNSLRIIVLVDEDLVPPDIAGELTEEERKPFEIEYNVISNLEKIGHEVIPVGIGDDHRVIRTAIEKHHPHVAFNLLEEFRGFTYLGPHIVGYLELLKQPYTGCNPRGLMLANDKALSKKILTFHRIHVPAFRVFPLRRKIRRSERLPFPMLVKSLVEDGSMGISQASIVKDHAALLERVDFIHRQTKTDAIAEQYIEGREIYVGVIGNQRLQTYTPWELVIKNLPDGARNIATNRIKWDLSYQKKVGLVTEAASFSDEHRKKIDHVSKRIYKLLSLSGYARIDYRLTEDGRLFLLEANPNPNIASSEDFAQSAAHCGVSFENLLQKIITLGLSYRPTL